VSDPYLDTVRRLIEEARDHADSSPSCVPPNRAPHVAMGRCGPWSIGLDVYSHNGIEHWRFSAQLQAYSSTTAEWEMLGRLFAHATAGTGYPCDAEPPREVIPIAELHPNATIHWQWHGDGSPVDPIVEQATRDALALVGPAVRPAPAAAAPQPGRNDPCPCGSGRKFKKCHGSS
jgi:hypothetical protein